MTRKLANLLSVENQYNFIVQLDYLAGLCTAYMLGAENWSLFFILLAVSLSLGIITVRVYIRMMKGIIKRRD